MSDWNSVIIDGVVVNNDDRELLKLGFVVVLIIIIGTLVYKSYKLAGELMWNILWSIPVFLFWDLVRCDLYRILRRVTTLNLAVCECVAARGDTLYGLAMLLLRFALKLVGFSQEDIAERLVTHAVDTIAKKAAGVG